MTDGSGLGVVTGTGMDTELGRISELAESTEKEATPLQKNWMISEKDSPGSQLSLPF